MTRKNLIREQEEHIQDIRNIFTHTGFTSVETEGQDIEFKGEKTEIDDVFLYENIIVLAEYTCTKKSEKIKKHFKLKKDFFNHISENKNEFIEFLETTFSEFKEKRDDIYNAEECDIVILYCSRHDLEFKHQQQVPNIKYLDYATLKYFKALSQTIKHSARTELLAFLGLPHHKEGHEMGQDDKKLPGYLLPASHSKLSKGYVAVTFYTTVTSLLNNAYVLRKDGWKNSENPYQRMVIKEKIDEMREYLLDKNKVFLNNIIVTLPSEASLVDEKGKEIDKTTKSKVVPITIQIPKKPNTIGIIDGQHRILSYHEGGKDDKDIKKLREKHALLVTGIIYPKGITEQEKVQFEAQLFLEVNANQTTASEDTRLYLNSVLKPFSAGAIAFKIVRQLNKKGALKGKIKEYFYEEDKLDANVWLLDSWYRDALQRLVSIEKKESLYHMWDDEEKKILYHTWKEEKKDSLYHIWEEEKKETLLQKKDEILLETYIDFCTKKINHFLDAVKKVVGTKQWTLDRNVKNSFLSSHRVRELFWCLARVVENRQTSDNVEGYAKKLAGLDKVNFKNYRQGYRSLGEDLYDRFFFTTANRFFTFSYRFYKEQVGEAPNNIQRDLLEFLHVSSDYYSESCKDHYRASCLEQIFSLGHQFIKLPDTQEPMLALFIAFLKTHPRNPEETQVLYKKFEEDKAIYSQKAQAKLKELLALLRT